MASPSDILDADRQLALSYVVQAHKAALEALWRMDATLGHILSSSSQPIAAQLRLAWWRDSFLRLDNHPAPAEPVLQGLQNLVVGRGIKGSDLAALVDGWEHLLATETLTDADFAAYASSRGGTLFTLSVRLLGEQFDGDLEAAGAGWALVDLARHSSKEAEATAALRAAAARLAQAPQRWPARLRPLGMLAVLARRDASSAKFETPGAPRRMLRMFRHRLTGR